jgi:hypothetical protein
LGEDTASEGIKLSVGQEPLVGRFAHLVSKRHGARLYLFGARAARLDLTATTIS